LHFWIFVYTAVGNFVGGEILRIQRAWWLLRAIHTAIVRLENLKYKSDGIVLGQPEMEN